MINSDHTTLQFAMPYAAVSMNGSYAILIDHGAVVGQGCSYDGPPTPGITNTSDWNFVADGVCLLQLQGNVFDSPQIWTIRWNWI